LGDENNEFKTNLPVDRNTKRPSTPAPGGVDGMGTWLTGENYRREREFKLDVMEWLNNGQPKLFRSPAEGNYIVRLMNVSLSPNDTLGRMLHTFTCSATEIAAPTFENFYDLLWNHGELDLQAFAKEYHYGLPVKFIAGKKYSPVKIYAGREQRTNADAIVCVLENVSNHKVTRLQYAIDLTTLVYLLGQYIVEDLIKYMQK
jgi:hypothetical protein